MHLQVREEISNEDKNVTGLSKVQQRYSSKNPADDMPVNAGEAHIAAAEAVCGFFVIESEKLKDRGVKDFSDILHTECMPTSSVAP